MGLNAFASQLEIQQLRLGDCLYKPGDPCDFLYLIKSGDITVTSQNTPMLRLSQSQFFGYYEPFQSLDTRAFGTAVT